MSQGTEAATQPQDTGKHMEWSQSRNRGLLRDCDPGQVSGPTKKTAVRKPSSHIKVPESQLHSWSQLPADVCPGVVHVAQSLLSTWEIQVEILASSFDTEQAQPIWS